MPKFVVSYVITDDSSAGEAGHVAAIISDEFPNAEPHADGVWLLDTEDRAVNILAKLSEGMSEDSVMICAIPAA